MIRRNYWFPLGDIGKGPAISNCTKASFVALGSLGCLKMLFLILVKAQNLQGSIFSGM
jgi:hypothetical protein